MNLFPRMQALQRNITWGNEWDRTWTNAKLACSAEYLPRYFSYGLRAGDLNDQLVDRLLALLDVQLNEDSPEAVERDALIETHLSPDIIDRFVIHLRKTGVSVGARAAEALLVALAGATSSLTDKGRNDFAIANNPLDQAALLMRTLLARVDSENRLELARAIAMTVEPLGFAVEFVQWLRPSETDPDDKLSAEAVAELARIVAERIASAAEGPPAVPVVDLYPPRPLRLVQMWHYSGEPEACRAHLTREITKDPAVLLRLVNAAMPIPYDAETSERRTPELRTETYEFLTQLVDPDVALQAFATLTGRDLSSAPPAELALDGLPTADQLALRFAHIHYSRLAAPEDRED